MTTTTSVRERTGTRGLAWAVLAAAVLEVVAPLVTINGPGASPGGGSGGDDLLITPVGWAFSIWGVIYTFALAQAVAVLVTGGRSTSRRLQVDLLVLYLAGATWIVVAAFESGVATALVLLVMLVAAVDAVLTFTREHMTPRWLSVLTGVAVGLYGGWVTAAFFLNLASALVEVGPVREDDLGWQLVALAAAALTLLAVLVRARGLPAYAAAGAWAMVGITVTANGNGTTEVVVTALVAIAVLAAATAALTLHHRRA